VIRLLLLLPFVSTILRKHRVGSRTQAAVQAERLSFGQPG
jgi:hypothetical protein